MKKYYFLLGLFGTISLAFAITTIISALLNDHYHNINKIIYQPTNSTIIENLVQGNDYLIKVKFRIDYYYINYTHIYDLDKIEYIYVCNKLESQSSNGDCNIYPLNSTLLIYYDICYYNPLPRYEEYCHHGYKNPILESEYKIKIQNIKNYKILIWICLSISIFTFIISFILLFLCFQELKNNKYNFLNNEVYTTL
jgi:hypothetical protein